jgi:diguanylate cyclase (GGDEF)-like protein
MAKENVEKVIGFIEKDSFQNGIATIIVGVSDSGEPMRGVRSFLGHSIVEALGHFQMEETFSREEVGILREAIRCYVQALILRIPPMLEPIGAPSGVENLQRMVLPFGLYPGIPEIYRDQRTSILVSGNQAEIFGQARLQALRDNLQFPLLGLVIRTAFHTADMTAENAELEIDANSGILTWAAAGLRLAKVIKENPERPCAVYMCDGDGMKGVNDRYGHDAGNAAMRAQAQTILNGARPGDIVARKGTGDEVVHVAFDVTCDVDAGTIAGRHVRTLASTPVEVTGTSGTIVRLNRTLSVGGALGKIGDLDELLKKADAALYLAKGAELDEDWSVTRKPAPAGEGQTGRNRAIIYPDREPVQSKQ